MPQSDLKRLPLPDWDELGRVSPLLAVLPASARRTSLMRELASGAVLFRRGDRPKAVYFVVTGEMRLIRGLRAGNEIVLQRARQGFFAEASVDHPAYHCDAVASEPTRLLAVHRKQFLDAMSTDAFRRGWLSHLTRELRRVRAHAERLSLRTARERVIHFYRSRR